MWENREFANSIWPEADPDVFLDFSIEGKHLKWTEAVKKENYKNANVTRWMDGFKSGGERFSQYFKKMEIIARSGES